MFIRHVWVVALILLGGLTRAEEAARPALDKEFLIQAAARGHAIVEYSKLAATRAESANVKDFAARVVTEQSKSNESLATHARNQKVAVLAGLEKDTRDVHDKLSKLKGGEFDRAYMSQITLEYEKAVALCDAQSRMGADADLKAHAKEHLPALQKQLKEAAALAAVLKDK